MQSVRPLIAAILVSSAASADVLVVTTEDNSSDSGLAHAISALKDGDTIRFNIPGAGPHLILTPPGGYGFLTNQNVTIDGYTQPGASPNTNGILSANNARIQIVLDSRNGNYRLIDDVRLTDADDPGFSSEGAILGIVGATNVTVRGLSFVGPASGGDAGEISMHSIALARGASGAHIAGNWLGVLPDGSTVAGTSGGITGLRYQGADELGNVTSSFINDTVIGVAKGSTNAPAEFNVILGQPRLPILIEGDRTRVAGNFLMVFPNGTNDFNVTDAIPGAQSRGAIAIGRGGNDTIIGTDGDGVNDENERNVIGGTYPVSKGGYAHSIEIYSPAPGTNIVVAGNYFGIAVDGVTRFTNGVPALNAAGQNAQYRFGSNLDGVSDAIEGNLVFNNWPPSIFDPAEFAGVPEQLNFFDELEETASISFRGNTLVNNFPAPASPFRSSKQFLKEYMAKVLADASGELAPVLAAESSTDHLVGTVPLSAAGYSVAIDVYVADAEGMQTGQATGIPEFSAGWVQGRQFLGSFTVDGEADQNPEPGAFDLSLSGLGLSTDTLVTATANYVAAAATTNAQEAVTITSPFSNAVPLQEGSGGPQADIEIIEITNSGDSIVLTWTGGRAPFTVETRANLDSATLWTTATTVNDRTATVPNNAKTGFFRIRSAP